MSHQVPPVSQDGAPPGRRRLSPLNRLSSPNALMPNTLEGRQTAWRAQHDRLMARKEIARRAAGENKCPLLAPMSADYSASRKRHSAPAAMSILPGAAISITPPKDKRRSSFGHALRRRPNVYALSASVDDEPLFQQTVAAKKVEVVSTSRRSSSPIFDTCVFLAKKHNHSVREVKRHWDTFSTLDTDKNGNLSKAEFEVAVRAMCGIAEDVPTPPHLLEQQYRSLLQRNKTELGFEEFLMWSVRNAFAEDVCCPDKSEKQLRDIARRHWWPLLEVERVKKIFDEYDADGSNSIDIDEFTLILRNTVGAKNDDSISTKSAQRYFAEANVDGSGYVDFEDFAVWFLTQGVQVAV